MERRRFRTDEGLVPNHTASRGSCEGTMGMGRGEHTDQRTLASTAPRISTPLFPAASGISFEHLESWQERSWCETYWFCHFWRQDPRLGWRERLLGCPNDSGARPPMADGEIGKPGWEITEQPLPLIPFCTDPRMSDHRENEMTARPLCPCHSLLFSNVCEDP